MRLLEPINGIKTIQGHYLVNLIFFIAIFTINKDIETNLREEEEYNIAKLHAEYDAKHSSHVKLDDPSEMHELTSYHQYIQQFYQEEALNDQDFVVLNSHASGHGDETAAERAERLKKESEEALPDELMLLNILQYLHLFGFFMIPAMMWLKSKECFLMKQGLQAFLMMTYFVFAWYIAYITKLHMSQWSYHMNEVRVMLFIEVSYIFTWIVSSMIFTTAAQLFNFKSTVLTDAILQMDDNIWNDRGADDFLRYIKHDFFTVVYIITHVFLTAMILLSEDKILRTLGKRDSPEMQTALALILFGRLNELFTQGYGMSSGSSIPKIRARSTIFKIYTQVFLWVMMFTIICYVGYLKKITNDFEGENLLTKIWINIECIAMILEVPYWFYTVEIKAQNIFNLEKDDQGSKGKDVYTSIQAEGGAVGAHIPKSSRQEELENQFLEEKMKLEYQEDFVSMTVLCFLKSNTDKYLIHPSKQAQMFYSCVIVYAVVDSLLFSMLYAIYINEAGEYTPNIAHNFAVWFVKFPCTLALHFVLCPEVTAGMNLMKYANNQPHQFVHYGSEVSYFLGLNQVFSALLCEGICIYMLAYQHTVSHCIIHFVALEVIMEVSNLYFESLTQNPLKAVMHHAPVGDYRAGDIKFKERSCFHKFARILYKMLRTFYVGVIYYYIPFAVMLIQWSTFIDEPDHNAHGGHGHH